MQDIIFNEMPSNYMRSRVFVNAKGSVDFWDCGFPLIFPFEGIQVKWHNYNCTFEERK